jgi:hypothetical protein
VWQGHPHSARYHTIDHLPAAAKSAEEVTPPRRSSTGWVSTRHSGLDDIATSSRQILERKRPAQAALLFRHLGPVRHAGCARAGAGQGTAEVHSPQRALAGLVVDERDGLVVVVRAEQLLHHVE